MADGRVDDPEEEPPQLPSLGELISLFYDEYLALYGDEELASVAAAAAINAILEERLKSSAEDAPS